MPHSSASSHEPEILRDVSFEPEYETARTRICGSVREADDFLAGLELFLSKRAEMGFAYRAGDPPNVATYLSKLLPSGSRIRVLYWYDQNLVRMISAWLVPGAAPRSFY